MSTAYFKNVVGGGSWYNAGNWFSNAAATTPLGGIPWMSSGAYNTYDLAYATGDATTVIVTDSPIGVSGNTWLNTGTCGLNLLIQQAVYSGNFTGTVTNLSNLFGGTFLGAFILSAGAVFGGNFSNASISSGTVSGGTFTGTFAYSSLNSLHGGIYSVTGWTTWLGGTSSDVTLSSNWSNGLPNSGMTVVYSGDGSYAPSGSISSSLFIITTGNLNHTSAILNVTSTNIRSNSAIYGGNFNGLFANSGSNYGGTFTGNFTNSNIGNIRGGTYQTYVNSAGLITDGIFNAAVVNTNNISGGNYNGYVTNSGTIQGGTFLNGFINTNVVNSGNFFGTVINTGTIQGGIFTATGITGPGAIYGGLFNPIGFAISSAELSFLLKSPIDSNGDGWNASNSTFYLNSVATSLDINGSGLWAGNRYLLGNLCTVVYLRASGNDSHDGLTVATAKATAQAAFATAYALGVWAVIDIDAHTYSGISLATNWPYCIGLHGVSNSSSFLGGINGNGANGVVDWDSWSETTYPTRGYSINIISDNTVDIGNISTNGGYDIGFMASPQNAGNVLLTNAYVEQIDAEGGSSDYAWPGNGGNVTLNNSYPMYTTSTGGVMFGSGGGYGSNGSITVLNGDFNVIPSYALNANFSYANKFTLSSNYLKTFLSQYTDTSTVVFPFADVVGGGLN